MEFPTLTSGNPQGCVSGQETRAAIFEDMGRAFEFRKERKMKRWAAMSKTFARLNKDIILSIKEGGALRIRT